MNGKFRHVKPITPECFSTDNVFYPEWGKVGKRPQLRASDMRQCAEIAPSSGRLSLSLGVISPSLRSLRQRVLVDLSVLHDDDEVLARVLDELDVLDRVAVDEKQVGQRAFFDDTELAGVRVALPGQGE